MADSTCIGVQGGSEFSRNNHDLESNLVPLETPCVYYVPSVIPPEEAASYYQTLHDTIPWEKTPKINRWVALYEEDSDNGYRYRDAPPSSSSSHDNKNKNSNDSKATSSSLSISSCPPIASVKSIVERMYESRTGTRINFNTCLANFYEDGNHRIGWHADREEIGRTTPIASVSLGATRTLLLRHKLHGATDRASVEMESGSVVIMENVCQERYLHSVPKQGEVTAGRINLTFRCKTERTAGEEEHERRDRWLERITTDDNANNNVNNNLEELSATEGKEDGRTVGSLFGDDVRFGRTAEDVYEGGVRYSVSCNIGTEGQCAAEITELISDERWEVVARPWGIAGYVACIFVRNEEGAVLQQDANFGSKLLDLRSALNVMQHHDHFALQDVSEANDGVSLSKIDGEMMYAFYKKRLEADPDLVPTLAAASADHVITFRVTTERIGDHAFRGPTIEYEMGGACTEVYEHAKPKMSDFDVNIRIDVVADRVIIGTQLNVDDLSKRHFLRYRNSVTIKTNLAYIMLRLANVREGCLVLDPFCGSGTLLLEGLEMTNRKIKCIGLDVSRRAAEGAVKNAQSEGYGPEHAEFHCSDARGLRKYVSDDHPADAIVSNLPWGVRTGHNQSVGDLQQLYETFLRCSWYVLKDGGRIVVLVLRGLQLVRILRKLSGRYRIIKCQVVRTTNNLPCIVVVEKVGRDVLHESVKSQLSYMSQFVNVSKEMYNAINNETVD